MPSTSDIRLPVQAEEITSSPITGFSTAEHAEHSRARRRFLSTSQPNTNSPDFHRFQRRNGKVWDRDWSALPRQIEEVIAAGEWLASKRPEAIGHLYTPDILVPDEFRRRVEGFRIDSARRLPKSERPPRQNRKFEYILALEYGACPKQAYYGRLHGHILLWNIRHFRIDDLKASWRFLNGITDEAEPVLNRLVDSASATSYVLKSMGSDADNIVFSRNLVAFLQKRDEEGDSL